MGVLFEMENDVKEIKGKFFRRKSMKNPLDFKVSLTRRDVPHQPTEEINGFTASSVAYNPFGNQEIMYLEYDAILKIDDTVLKMQFQELLNLSSAITNAVDNFQRYIHRNSNHSELSSLITTLRQAQA